jgi:hypothetical protein
LKEDDVTAGTGDEGQPLFSDGLCCALWCKADADDLFADIIVRVRR